MNPDNDSVRRERRNKPYTKNPNHSNTSSNDNFSYHNRGPGRYPNPNKPDQYNGFQKQGHGHIHGNDSGYFGPGHPRTDDYHRELVLAVNDAQIRVFRNESLGDSKLLNRLADFVSQLKIDKQFERDALMLKLVRELESRGFGQLDKQRYGELVDKFIHSAMDQA